MANPQRPGRRTARRGSAIAASLIALAAGAGLSFLGARAAADFIEARSAAELRPVLAGYAWLSFRTDGLQVRLDGIAPDEVQRFRARARAETVVDPGRIVDTIQVAASARLAPPAFEIELLRNGRDLSFIGLAPAALDRKALVAQIRRQTGAAGIADLMETADYPVPEGWDAAFAFGLKAAALAERAKISVKAGRVSVRAITDSPGEKAELEVLLERARPPGVVLAAEISAPRPVIAPFALRLVKDATGARLDACAADSEAARDRILAAAHKAGAAGTAPCVLGLGAPGARWADAATAAIAAVGELAAGAVTISDSEVALFAPRTVDAARFADVAGRLETALPPGFTFSAEHEAPDVPAEGPADFVVTLAGDGVSLRGRIANDRMRAAVESLARARFGIVDSALLNDAGVPQGWTLRAIAALEALEGLQRGTITVTPDLVRVSGVSGSQTALDMVAARLSRRLGAGARYELAIRYDRRLDGLLDLPSGVECVDRLNAAMQESEIGFEPNKAVIAGDPAPTLARLAETMRNCAAFRIEIGGHTDAQGSEARNAELSRTRAQAVFKAMAEAGIDTSRLTARGYGESQPIAENDSDAGREANRRIEFTLLADEPVLDAAPEPARTLTGVTDDPEAIAARTQGAARAAATGAVAPVLGASAVHRAATAPAAALLPPGPAPADIAANLARRVVTQPPRAPLPGAVLPDLVPMPPPDLAAGKAGDTAGGMAGERAGPERRPPRPPAP